MRKVNAVKNRDTTHIEISRDTHNKLGDFGKKNESYDEIVKRLINTVKMYEEKHGKEEVTA